MIILKLRDSNSVWLLQLRRFSGEEQALCSDSESFNYINGGRLYIFLDDLHFAKRRVFIYHSLKVN